MALYNDQTHHTFTLPKNYSKLLYIEMNIENGLKLLFPTVTGVEFFATGSRVYGYPQETSDYDVLVHESFKTKIVNALEKQKIEVTHSNYFNCIKFDFLSIKINIVFMDNRNLEAWKLSTQAMLAFKNFVEDTSYDAKSVLIDKNYRYALFGRFLKQFGGDDAREKYDSTLRKSRILAGLEDLAAVKPPGPHDIDIPF